MKIKLSTGESRALERGELKRIARQHNIDYNRLYQRIKADWTLEEAIAGKRSVPQPQKRNQTSFQTEEPKDKFVGFRMSQENYQKIESAIESETLTDWLTDAALSKVEGRVIPFELYEKIKRISEDPQKWIKEQLEKLINGENLG